MAKGSGGCVKDLQGLRFGRIAYKQGHVRLEQLHEALCEQVDDDVAGRPHRLLGTILLGKGWMTPEQVEAVLAELDEEAPGGPS